MREGIPPFTQYIFTAWCLVVQSEVVQEA